MFGRPVRIADGVFQLRALGARVTVLAKDGNAILVDSGLPGSSRIIMRGLRDCGIAYERISRVVVTHAHPDHSGGLAELAGGTGITVAVHEAEADIVEGIAPAPDPLRSRFLAALTRPAMSRLKGAPVRVDERLKDGDLVPFPSEVRVVHLPGHTPGSVGLHLPQSGIVVVGDALQYKFGWRLYPPAPGVTDRPDTAMHSLEKLLSLDFQTICFSHFPPLRKNAWESLRRLVERHAGRTSRSALPALQRR